MVNLVALETFSGTYCLKYLEALAVKLQHKTSLRPIHQSQHIFLDILHSANAPNPKNIDYCVRNNVPYLSP